MKVLNQQGPKIPSPSIKKVDAYSCTLDSILDNLEWKLALGSVNPEGTVVFSLLFC